MFNNLYSRKSYRLWDDVEHMLQPDRPQMMWNTCYCQIGHRWCGTHATARSATDNVEHMLLPDRPQMMWNTCYCQIGHRWCGTHATARSATDDVEHMLQPDQPQMMWNTCYSQIGHRCQDNMAHALCILDNKATDTRSEYVMLITFPWLH
jgi:hypothetical protein